MADNQFITIKWADSEANPSLLIGLRKVSQSSDIHVSYYERVPEPASIASAADVVETGPDNDSLAGEITVPGRASEEETRVPAKEAPKAPAKKGGKK